MKRCVLVLLFLTLPAPLVRAQSVDERKATVAWLQALQMADGGFLSAAPNPASNRLNQSSLRSTSSGLRALKYFGGKPKDSAAAAAFIEKCYDKDSGGFVDFPKGKPDVAVTAVGIMAVVAADMPTKSYAESVSKYLSEKAKSFEDIRIAVAGFEALGQRPAVADEWLKEVAKLRHDDGTYGKDDGVARETGGATVVVLRLGAEVEKKENVLKALKAGQRGDGGFGKAGAKGSDLETTYRVMRCFWMLKEEPANPDKLRAFITKCRNADGGYGVTPGQESTVSGTYYAGSVLHWLAEK
jgi:hypothetical protein